MASTINASTVSGIVQSADTSGVLALQTGGTTALTVTTAQKVGIGTASPSKVLQVQSNTNEDNRTIRLSYDGTYYADLAQAGAGGLYFRTYGGTAFSWEQSGTQAMYLDGSANLKFNSGYGSVATAYGCRAWVNFNGSGTVAIRASGNVSSVTDNGQGNYLVNFATVMPDTSYSVSYTASDRPGVDYGGFASTQQSGFTNSYIGLITGTPYALGTYDPVICSVAVFR